MMLLEGSRVSVLALVELGIARDLVCEWRLSHLDRLDEAILLGHLKRTWHISGAGWNALGTLTAESRALSGGAALDCKSQLFRHFRAQGLLRRT